MNKRTKFYIGVTLVVSAITTTVTFIALCFKKKSAVAALAALAAAEGLIGLSLIEDNNVLKHKKSPETVTVPTEEETTDSDAAESDVTEIDDASADDIA